MKSNILSAFVPRFSSAILPATFLLLTGGVGMAQTTTNLTSIGQPILLSFGSGPGQTPFSGSFNIDPAFDYNFLYTSHALNGVATTNGANNGVYTAATLGLTTSYSYNIRDYEISAGNHIPSGSLPFSYLDPAEIVTQSRSRTATAVATAATLNYDPEGVPSPLFLSNDDSSTFLGINLTPTKSFDFTTVQGSSEVRLSSNFPQGAAISFRLQVSDGPALDQQNTSIINYRIQPGTVSPSSFTTATTSLFRWDLKGNTTEGAGTNWTQINFANQVATFTAGTQFVIAFDETTNFLDSFWRQNRSWDIFNGGTVTGDGADDFLANLNFTFIGGLNRPSNIPNGYNASKFSFDQTTGTLNWTAIPEPTSALSGLLLAAGLMRRRRR